MPLDFEPLDLAEITAESTRVNSEPNARNDDASPFVRLPERDGFVMLRFLPRKKGGKLYCATRLHRLTNFYEPDKAKSLHCPRELTKTDRGEQWRGDCVICRYYSDLWSRSERAAGKEAEALQNQARSIKPVERYYYNVIVREEKDKQGKVLKNVGPKIYSCGKTVHAKILRAITGDPMVGEKPLGDITHPINGRDFRLIKKVVKGGGGNEYPNYDLSKFEDVSPLGDMDDMERWIANLHDLSALRVVLDEEALRHELRVHLGMIREEGSSDDLAEFRGGAVLRQPEAAVREELTTPSAPREEVKAAEDQVLADDDFINELAAMKL